MEVMTLESSTVVEGLGVAFGGPEVKSNLEVKFALVLLLPQVWLDRSCLPCVKTWAVWRLSSSIFYIVHERVSWL